MWPEQCMLLGVFEKDAHDDFAADGWARSILIMRRI